MNVADIVNEKTGKTYRQENLEKVHNIPLKTLVEVYFDGGEDRNGLRLFVVDHQRDCDGTPLYGLSYDKNWSVDMLGRDFKFATRCMVDGGYSEECLTIIND